MSYDLKKLGIIGGMGSRAGAMFFQKIIDYSPARTDQEFIEVILHSNAPTPDRTRAIVYGEASPLLQLARSVKLLNDEQVDYIVMTCVTSHYYLDSLQKLSNALIINPIDLVVKELKRKKANRVGVLATTGTLQTGLFQRAIDHEGIELICLSPKHQEEYFMQSVYMENGLKSSKFCAIALQLFDNSVEELKKAGAEILIGGCSEVPLILDSETHNIDVIDTMDELAKEVIRRCYLPVLESSELSGQYH